MGSILLHLRRLLKSRVWADVARGRVITFNRADPGKIGIFRLLVLLLQVIIVLSEFRGGNCDLGLRMWNL